MLAEGSILAATFFVGTNGDDAQPGSSDRPWRTIAKGAQSAQPGDTIVVREGSYPERILSVRGGRGENSRITFRAEGHVVMRGFRVNHPFITIDGFDITGHSALSTIDSHVRVDRNGEAFQMFNCTVRDALQLVRDDFRFESQGSRIVTETGGLLAAGLAPGIFINLDPATNRASLTSTNTRTLLVSEVTDTSLTVTNVLNDQPPQRLYLTAASIYGLSFDSATRRAVVRDCRFSNLGLDALFVIGTNHVIEGNVIERMNGWNAMHFGGKGHLFRHNVIRDSPAIAHSPSPDAFDNFAPAAYDRVVFKQNLVQGFQGVIAAQKGAGTSSNLLFLRNVFVDAGWLTLTHPATRIENNTFLRCAKVASTVVALASHPVSLRIADDEAPGADNARHTVIRNNAFIDCGQATGSIRPPQTGWYEVRGPANTLVAEGNFVSGGAPDFAPKEGWPENPDLNGGNPLLTNIDDVLGPDGIPFTPDDGLRPSEASRLVGAGVGARSIGAYNVSPPVLPRIHPHRNPDGSVVFSWPETHWDWTLEIAPTPSGPWRGYPAWPETIDGHVIVTVDAADANSFFRLAE
jgi:hypothetical protein